MRRVRRGKGIAMSSMDDIRITGDPILEEACEPIEDIDDEVKDLARSMLETMYEAEGCGLAAPQVGVKRRLVVVDCEWGSGKKTPYVLINPEIVEASDETRTTGEGCLSFPGVTVQVERPRRVVVHATNLDGDVMRYEAEDSLLAVCLQHEIDHLDGKTLLDHLGPMGRMRVKKQVREAIEAGAKPGDVSKPEKASKSKGK